MALINCSECEKQVSDKAAACPNCGNPIATVQPKMTRPIDDFKPVENKLRCPKCNSTNLTANKKGYSAGKAVAGVVLTGGVGLLAGAIGSGKVDITCLSCGYKYRAGEYQKEKNKLDNEKSFIARQERGEESFIGLIFLMFILSIIGCIISYNLFSNDWNFFGTLFTIATLICIVITIFSIYCEVSREPSRERATIKTRIEDNTIDREEYVSNEEYAKSSIDNQIREYIKNGKIEKAINFYSKLANVSFAEANDYVNKIAAE